MDDSWHKYTSPFTIRLIATLSSFSPELLVTNPFAPASNALFIMYGSLWIVKIIKFNSFFLSINHLVLYIPFFANGKFTSIKMISGVLLI